MYRRPFGMHPDPHKWQNSAARRRCHAKRRAALIRLLGWEPETHGVMHPTSYCASTAELRAEVHDQLARAPRCSTQVGDTLERDGVVIRVWRVWNGHVVVKSGHVVWGPSDAGEVAALRASVAFHDCPAYIPPRFASDAEIKAAFVALAAMGHDPRDGWQYLGTFPRGHEFRLRGDRAGYPAQRNGTQWVYVPVRA